MPAYKSHFTLILRVADYTNNVTVENLRSSYQVGARLVCSADGNPPPTYKWKNLVTGSITEGPVLGVLRDEASSHALFFQCQATNHIGVESVTAVKNISFTIEEDRTVGRA